MTKFINYMGAQNYQHQHAHPGKHAGWPAYSKHPLERGIQKKSDPAQTQHHGYQFNDNFNAQNTSPHTLTMRLNVWPIITSALAYPQSPPDGAVHQANGPTLAANKPLHHMQKYLDTTQATE